MSTKWQDYVDVLMGSGFISSTGIYGLNPAMKWAASKDFSTSLEQVKGIGEAFTDPAELRQKGILFRKKYTPVRIDDDVIIGRVKDGGCVISRCHRCLLMATFNDPYQANCVLLLMKLATYFKDKDF